ncbi:MULTISPECIES: hypothetical protein [unclassified Bradyrhizobium]|uniref:hypothetical protein n=1 Tax=Bradyrhizobium sp. WBAH23 TaxID=1390119 RepID=UPI0015867861|nr:hypothetical protein [Bradyrhizobium sp. WBAH23]
MEIAATAVEKTTARVRDIAVVPQLPEMDLRRWPRVYAAKSRAAEVHQGILNANGTLSPDVQNSLTIARRTDDAAPSERAKAISDRHRGARADRIGPNDGPPVRVALGSHPPKIRQSSRLMTATCASISPRLRLTLLTRVAGSDMIRRKESSAGTLGLLSCRQGLANASLVSVAARPVRLGRQALIW